MKHMKFVLLAIFLSSAIIAGPGPMTGRAQDAKADIALQAAIKTETVDGDLRSAIEQYKKIAALPGAGRSTVAAALLRMGQCWEKLGDAEMKEARKAYERVILEYGDQASAAAEARAKLAALATASTAPGGTTLSVRRVWAGDIEGQVSPDGRFLSFTDWGKGGNLAIFDIASGESRLLTDTGSLSTSEGFAEYSVPSPDGRSVAFAWRGTTYDLRIVGLDGSKTRILRAGGDAIVHQYPVAWSPDGKHVLAEIKKADGNLDMILVSVPDGSEKLLKAAGKNPSPGGVFSPDGRYIAWSTKEGLSLYDLQTGAESLLISDRTNHSVLGWFQDGRYILFSSERSGSADAWLVAVAGGRAQGEPIFIRKNWGNRPMGLTRSGAFYFAVNNTVGDVKVAELDPASGNVVSPPRSISPRGNTWSPDWSPDGRFLAYILAREHGRTVMVRTLETGEEKEYQPGERTIGMESYLRWLPDSAAVAVPVFSPGEGETLIRIDVQTGRVTSLMPLPSGYSFPKYGFSPDGKTIYYVLVDQGLFAHDLSSGRETNVIKREGLYAGVVSPDGRRLAIGVTKDRYQILLAMPVSGGEPRELVRIDPEKEAVNYSSPWWTPDSRYICFLRGVKGVAPKEFQVWRVSADDGEPQRLGLNVGRQFMPLRVHPDGRRVAINDFKVNLEVWVMENFLPGNKSAK